MMQTLHHGAVGVVALKANGKARIPAPIAEFAKVAIDL